MKNLLDIKNSTETSVDLYFYGDIVDEWSDCWNEEDKYPQIVNDFLKENKGKDLNIYINSNGGSVFSGIAIYNMLMRHQGHKTVYVDGLAASIGSVISMAGDEIVIPSNSYLMVHRAWCGTYGNSQDLRVTADLLDKLNETIVGIYETKLKEGVSTQTIKDLMDKESWLSGSEVAEYFNVTVTDAVKAVACVSDLYKNYKNVPKDIIQKIVKPIENKNKIDLDYYRAKVKTYELD